MTDLDFHFIFESGDRCGLLEHIYRGCFSVFDIVWDSHLASRLAYFHKETVIRIGFFFLFALLNI